MKILAVDREAQIAWAAGLFEGEGYFSIANRRRKDITMGLAMADKDVVERFVAIMGVGTLRQRMKPNVLWRWDVYKKSDVETAINLLMPYFGDRRRAKAQEMLDHIKTMPGTGKSYAKIELLRSLGLKE